MSEPHTYTIQVAREIAEQYTEWTAVKTLRADWFKVIPRKDGTAEVWLSIGDEPPAPG